LVQARAQILDNQNIDWTTDLGKQNVWFKRSNNKRKSDRFVL